MGKSLARQPCAAVMLRPEKKHRPVETGGAMCVFCILTFQDTALARYSFVSSMMWLVSLPLPSTMSPAFIR